MLTNRGYMYTLDISPLVGGGKVEQEELSMGMTVLGMIGKSILPAA